MKTEIAIQSAPAEVAAAIRASSPATSTVVVERFSRKGQDFLLYAAGEGSPDGLPVVTVRA